MSVTSLVFILLVFTGILAGRKFLSNAGLDDSLYQVSWVNSRCSKITSSSSHTTYLKSFSKDSYHLCFVTLEEL